MQSLYSVNLIPSARSSGCSDKATFWQHWLTLVSLLLVPGFCVAETPAKETKHSVDSMAPDWCSNYRIPLSANNHSGRAVIRTSLLANMRLAVPVNPVRVTLVGLGDHLPIVTSELQCSNLVVFDQLPTGEYRVGSIEGSVDLFTAPKRFLYPLPQDGYQLIFTGGHTGLYRAQIPRETAAIIKVETGATHFIGDLTTTPRARHPWGVSFVWDHSLNAQTALCDAFNQAYELPADAAISSCDPLGTSEKL